VVRRDPREFGQTGSRWSLDKIRAICFFIGHYTRSGIWRLLDDLDIHWKHARDHVCSPDPDYLAKQDRVALCQALVRDDPTHQILVFQDEFTYYRQPSGAFDWAAAGSKEPLAERSHRANTGTRVAAALNFLTGQVTALQAPRLGLAELVRFYQRLCQTYPQAQRIYVVQDNWPIHFHPDVLAALEPQENPFPWLRPANWPTEPSPQARRLSVLNLPIQLVPLPTYASWTNPIEKLWRWLKQERLHLHRWADDLAELRRQVLDFLAQFAHGSLELLRYVGLLTPK
jgi:DDE superfamily endonuclease